MLETDVLIVGCGPSGLTAAIALARRGVKVLAVTKHARLAPTPRAHVTNQRTFEILRDFGIESRVREAATDYSEMPDQIFLRSLVGQEFGRIKGLGQELTNNINASPCALADVPQHLLEPILFDAAKAHDADIRFVTEMKSFSQNSTGVTATLIDRRSDQTFDVRARYMIGADGGRSSVADQLGLAFEGPGRLGGSLNIVFECDLAPHVAYRPALLFFIVPDAQSAARQGLGFLRCVRPWSAWMLTIGYGPGQETPDITFDQAEDVIRSYLGIPDLECVVTSIDPWSMTHLRATQFDRGRVFCVGDAVHRHVPSNGLGSNTGIQDAYNLSWKLELVLRGVAMPPLLDTYSRERAPVAKQVVERVTKSLESYAPILAAIGATPGESAELAAATESGVRRRSALRAAIHEKIHEFQARGIELNQRYRSTAIIGDNQGLVTGGLDPELFFIPTTTPGAHLPHAWIQRDGHPLSTLDLVGHGQFTILTGIGGEAWLAAAEAVKARFHLDLVAHTIGPGCEFTDLYFEWADRCEILEDGCLLVRPDGHVAWRYRSHATDAVDRLISAMSAILCLPLSQC